MDLLLEIQAKMQQLDLSLKSLRKTGTEYAQAEKEYKEAVSKKVLELRASDTPVTAIQLEIYGLPDISVLRFKRDIAQTVYESNKEALNVLKLELRILQSQYEREWSSEE